MKKSHVAVIYGTDPIWMVPRVMDHFEISNAIPKGVTIGIKPNLVVAKPFWSGATTDPKIVEAIIVYLKSHGFDNIVILESSWVGDQTERAFEVCGYRELEKRLGVPLLNLEQDASDVCYIDGLGIHICRSVREIGYLINVPVLKVHSQTKLTCALKNLKGLIPPSEKQRFHAIGLSRPIACLSKIVRSDFAIVDGIIGDLTFEEGGSPVQMNRLIAGKDPVAVDAYASTLLGYNPREIDYITMAEALGVGVAALSDIAIDALNSPKTEAINLPDPKEVQALRRYIDESDACSPCIGVLLHALKRMNDAGTLGRVPCPLSIGQGFINKIGLGIGIGDCTAGFRHSLAGCPPTAGEIKDFILRYIE